MSAKPPLHVLFTMDCRPRSLQRSADLPGSWELSARSIEGYCDVLLRFGYPPTLFVAPECAEQHEPMLEELSQRGAELALFVEPRTFAQGKYKKALGQYGEAEQREIIGSATDRFRDAFGIRPQSLRSGAFSASDVTFKAAYEAGFRQGSVSSPGRNVSDESSRWADAPPDPHYVDPANRLSAGTLPFLEVPVTTDPSEQFGKGVPFELCVEYGVLDAYHVPIIQKELGRIQGDGARFPTLCLYSRNIVHYYDRNDRHARTLAGLVDYIEGLRGEYEIIPSTMFTAHEQFIRRQAG